MNARERAVDAAEVAMLERFPNTTGDPLAWRRTAVVAVEAAWRVWLEEQAVEGGV